jgi:hypothetical protein
MITEQIKKFNFRVVRVGKNFLLWCKALNVKKTLKKTALYRLFQVKIKNKNIFKDILLQFDVQRNY